MTLSVNLKRKEDETIEDDGTHVKCRFLDDKGGCSMHPSRPGVICIQFADKNKYSSNASEVGGGS